MAPWQSGYAADCKSVDLGSTPGGASTFFNHKELNIAAIAVMKDGVNLLIY